MKSTAKEGSRPQPAAARVLVVSDNSDDAAQIVKQLEADFNDLHASSQADHAVADFERVKPEVLVLGFDSIDKAQDCALALYRSAQQIQPHRTVLLCAKGDVRAAFEHCKKGTFDDYLLFWPHAQDGLRLSMCVWNAARQVIAQPAREGHERQRLLETAQLASMQTLVDREVAEGDRHAASAEESLKDAERAIGAAIDELSKRLTGGDFASGGARGGLSGEIEQLKRPVSAAMKSSAQALAPVRAWSGELRDKLSHRIEDLRAIHTRLRKVKPVVMVVDDDDVLRVLMEGALRGSGYELVFATDGATALGLARRVHPDVILMDVHLPDGDGVALTQTLKSHTELAEVPILMLTGDARRETLEKSLSAGAVGFIVKPFTREALLSKLARFLEADG